MNKRTYSEKAQQKIEKVMHEFSQGDVKSGKTGEKITNGKQAVAIGLSEARTAGLKVPKKKA